MFHLHGAQDRLFGGALEQLRLQPGNAFLELALLLLACALAGGLFVRLRQPVLIAYIVVGIGVGPAGLGLVGAHEQIDLLAQIGVAVLLFAVGLKLDLQHCATSVRWHWPPGSAS